MVTPQSDFPLGLTFDDVLLLPGYSDFSRGDITLSTKLTKKIDLSIPLVSSPMDTVTEAKLAITLASLGGIGIIHRNLSVADQAREVEKVKKAKVPEHSTLTLTLSQRERGYKTGKGKTTNGGLLVGAAIGAAKGYEERLDALVKAGIDVILIDSAHGYVKPIIDAVSKIKNKYKRIEVIAGSIATADGAKALIDAGADALRVGMGPGAICTTRIISGMGVPQITALTEVCRVAKRAKVPVIADGGIKYSGDMVKALAVGASVCMMGSFFASALESPGDVQELLPGQVPARFQSIFHKKQEKYLFKSYRGMGSIGAMEHGAKIKSEDEFHGKNYKDRVLVAEGVEGLVPIKGTVQELVDQALGGIRSGMFYIGAKTISELQKKAKFIQITQASLTESHPHSILVTNPGANY